MTDGQHLIIAMISASVLLVILQFLKRRLFRNEPRGKRYDAIDPALGHQFSSHPLEPLLIVEKNSSGPGKHN
jgi:hypothetical protein